MKLMDKLKKELRCNKKGLSIAPNKWEIVGETPKSLFLH